MDRQLGKARSSKRGAAGASGRSGCAPTSAPSRRPSRREHPGLRIWCLDRHQGPSPFIPSRSCPGEGSKNFLKTLLHTAGQDVQCQGQEKKEPFQLPEPPGPGGLVFQGPLPAAARGGRARAGPWTPPGFPSQPCCHLHQRPQRSEP